MSKPAYSLVSADSQKPINWNGHLLYNDNRSGTVVGALIEILRSSVTKLEEIL